MSDQDQLEPLFTDGAEQEAEEQSLLDEIMSSLEEELPQEPFSESEPRRQDGYASSQESPQESLQMRSEVLKNLPDAWLPPEECACRRCPSALWHRSRDTVKCYCGRLFSLTYESKRGHADADMIFDCDGLYMVQEGS